jgi:uncharacterized protein (TIGR02118 family)
MIKILVLYPWPEDPEHFRRHYLARHLPLCRDIPGILHSYYTFEPRSLGVQSKWFCIYEAEFDSADALEEALKAPEMLRASADIQNYSPDQPTVLIYNLSPV